MLRGGTYALIATVALVLGAGLAAAGGDDDFKPKVLKGSWTGKWQNSTAGTSGDITATVKFRKQKLSTTVDFSGDPFGCGNPPPGTATLRHGTGNNTWNAAGFKVDEPTAGFGDLTLIYRLKRNKLTANGNSPCNPGTTFRLSGKLKESSMSATVDVDAGGTRSTGQLSAGKG